MNRGRHKKNNISRINNTKKYLLLDYNAKDLNKWKDFTLEELKYLIKETSKQQEDYSKIFNKPLRKVDLSLYERNWSAGRSSGGINWALTKEGHNKWRNLMCKLYN